MKDVRAEDLLTIAGQSYPVAGRISGDFMATGKYPKIELQGVARCSQWESLLGQSYEQAALKFTTRSLCCGRANLDVQIGTGRVVGSATVDITSETVRSSYRRNQQIPLDQLPWLRVQQQSHFRIYSEVYSQRSRPLSAACDLTARSTLRT